MFGNSDERMYQLWKVSFHRINALVFYLYCCITRILIVRSYHPYQRNSTESTPLVRYNLKNDYYFDSNIWFKVKIKNRHVGNCTSCYSVAFTSIFVKLSSTGMYITRNGIIPQVSLMNTLRKKNMNIAHKALTIAQNITRRNCYRRCWLYFASPPSPIFPFSVYALKKVRKKKV